METSAIVGDSPVFEISSVVLGIQQEFEILSQETGISVLILEVIGSMHFQVKLAERENRTYDPRMGMSKDTEKELKKLGFTIPNPTFRFGH